MHITRLDPAKYKQSPWKNGGGVTIDIAEARMPGSAPGSWSGLIWRLGRTTISQAAPFSDLAGFDRCQVVTGGSGLVLDTPQGEVDLRRPFVPARYRGEAPIMSRLESGPVEVVNLIADRSRAAIGLEVLEAGHDLMVLGGLCICHAAAGEAAFAVDGLACTLAPDQALRFDGFCGLLSGVSGRVVVALIHAA